MIFDGKLKSFLIISRKMKEPDLSNPNYEEWLTQIDDLESWEEQLKKGGFNFLDVNMSEFQKRIIQSFLKDKKQIVKNIDSSKFLDHLVFLIDLRIKSLRETLGVC